mgnify:CR=1 FL=1
MIVSELKLKLHQKIDQIEDEDILMDAIQLLDLELNNEKIDLPEELIEKIKSGIAEINDGKVKSHEQANLETEKWLKGK